MKFLLDMPVSRRTTLWLLGRGFDAMHARDLGLARAADTEILERAVREERIVLTMDVGIPTILALSQAVRPGIILFRMQDPRPPLVQERLDCLFRTHPEVQIISSITVIEDERIRIRKLPIS